MSDPQKYDRAAAFEMLKKEHGEYASPELINQELDSFEKANGFASNKLAPADAVAPPVVSKQDQELQEAAKTYALPPSSARQQLESITSANPSTTTPVNNALDSFSKLSTKEQLLYGGGAAALAALATKKAGEIAVEGATKLKDRFFGDSTKPPINTNTQSATNAPLGETDLKLSPVDQQILERANVNKQVRQEYLSRTMGNAEPALTATPEPVVQTPEQITQAKLAAATQAAQQNMAAPPPETAPKKMWEPPKAELAISQPQPAPVAAPPVEPVAPVEVAPALAETPKNTNEKILETINKVAPKAEATPVKSTFGEPDLTTGSGMPAYQGKGEEGGKLKHKKGVFESLNQIPKDYVFVPNGQNMDTVRNSVGQVEYTKNLKSSGGYPESQQAAHEQSKSINQSLGRVSNAEAKAAGTFVEPTPSITQKVAGVKTIKVAGMTGALILATDLANAATTGESLLKNMAEGFKDAVKNKDYGMAASQAAQLLNFHPYTFLANELFGSSPEELQILRQADQARKAKAGSPKSTGK